MIKELPPITIGDTYQDREHRTWCNVTLYNGKTYKVRVVLDKDGERLLIGNDDFCNTVHPGEWGAEYDGFDPTAPKKAEYAYDEIFFFTDDTTFNYSDEDLRKDMAEENPDWFD